MKSYFAVLSLLFFLACSKSGDIKRQQLFLKGNIALEENDNKQAIYYYSQSIELSDTFAAAFNNRAIAYEREGEYQDALHDYERAIQVDPEFKKAYFNRAKLWNDLKNYKNALIDLDLIKDGYKDSANFYFIKGLSNTGLKNFNEAIADFKMANELDPENAETLINLATIYYYQKQFERAGNTLSEVPSDKSYPEAFNLQSLLLAKQGKFDEAIENVNKAIQLNSNPYYYNNRGYIFLMKDDLEKGIKDIDHSLLVDDKNPWAYRNKGIYYFLNEEYENAMKMLHTSLNLDSTTEYANYYLGLIHQQLNNKVEACHYFQKSIELKEDSAIDIYQEYCD